MTGKSHLTLGTVTYAALWFRPAGPALDLPLLDLPPLRVPLFAGSAGLAAFVVALALVALGSLLPDIDHPSGSLAQKKVLGLRPLKPFAHGIGVVFGHRGATHSLLALLATLAFGEWPAYPWAGYNVGWLIGWGFALHLLADALTKSGIPLLWPLPVRFGLPPPRDLRLSTGTWREGAIVGAVTLAAFLYAVDPWLT